MSSTPSSVSAVSHTNQQITCYLANAGTEFPARPGGYKYILALTAASQYKVYGDFSGGPRIPFGTWVTLSQTVDFPSPAEDTNRFRIDDMGDKYQTRTPYFVDLYFGSKQAPYTTNCTNFGVKRITVTD
jgi:hypothetical protein